VEKRRGRRRFSGRNSLKEKSWKIISALYISFKEQVDGKAKKWNKRTGRGHGVRTSKNIESVIDTGERKEERWPHSD